MATIDWAVLCELAFFDRHDRLNVIGMFREFYTPELPIVMRQAMLVARLADIRQADGFAVTVGIVTPDGRLVSATGDGIAVEVVHDYVLVTLHDVPLRLPGLYRFRIALTGQGPVFVDVTLTSLDQVAASNVH